MTDILRFHEDPFDDTRWRVQAANGEPTMASTEGYVDHRDAFNNAARYLLIEPTDDPDKWVVHTTHDLLGHIQALNALAGSGRLVDPHEILRVTSHLRRLLQIPGGAL